MDTIQILLLVVLSLSTIFLTVVGIQLVIVLREMSQALKNVNKIIQGFDTVGTGLNHGIGEVVGFINGFKTILKVVDITRKKNDNTK